MSQESFFERGEDSMMRKQKTMTVNKRQVALKRKYQESYMFITTGIRTLQAHFLHVMTGLSLKVTKSSKLLHQMEIKHLALKEQVF